MTGDEFLVEDDGPRHLYTAAESERVLGIPAATVRTWAFRKLIYAYGLDDRDRPMYDRDDLVRLRDLRDGA